MPVFRGFLATEDLLARFPPEAPTVLFFVELPLAALLGPLVDIFPVLLGPLVDIFPVLFGFLLAVKSGALLFDTIVGLFFDSEKRGMVSW